MITRRTFAVGVALVPFASSASAQTVVAVQTPDKAVIGGRLYGRGKRGVLLVPGGHGIGATWHYQAQSLANAGFRVLAIDFRGLGAFPGTQDDGKTDLDVVGAVRHLKAAGTDRVAVVGASWGGRAAALASIAYPGLIDRLVLLAPSEFDGAERLGGRKLLVLAGGDRDGAGRARLDVLRPIFDRMPDPKQLIILPGDAHAQFLYLTPQAERLTSEIHRFLIAP